MSGSPRFKIFNHRKEYIASCKHAEDAAILVGHYGEGAQVKDGHSFVVWTEGVDGNAGNSFDSAAAIMWMHIEARNAANHIKWAKRDADFRERYTGKVTSITVEQA